MLLWFSTYYEFVCDCLMNRKLDMSEEPIWTDTMHKCNHNRNRNITSITCMVEDELWLGQQVQWYLSTLSILIINLKPSGFHHLPFRNPFLFPLFPYQVFVILFRNLIITKATSLKTKKIYRKLHIWLNKYYCNNHLRKIYIRINIYRLFLRQYHHWIICLYYAVFWL